MPFCKNIIPIYCSSPLNRFVSYVSFFPFYQARKTFTKQPQQFYASIMGLPTNEKGIAFKMLGKAGLSTPLMNIPTNKVQLVMKAIKQLKHGMGKAMESGSIGV